MLIPYFYDYKNEKEINLTNIYITKLVEYLKQLTWEKYKNIILNGEQQKDEFLKNIETNFINDDYIHRMFSNEDKFNFVMETYINFLNEL